ncbi:hypothetical protein HYW36_01670 [Candidatus Saccharibacteria bacterium]|nr:hypothetical protein [Candidatus Saccharibacteria bacterium]
MKNKTVAILHGWAGGKWHVRRFVKALKDSGFELGTRQANADIIVAHSTGCYRLKENTDAKLVVLIGPPYWPSKSILHRLLRKKGHDTHHQLRNEGVLFTINKLLFEIIYVIIKPSYSFIALKHHRYLHCLDLLENKEVILIRNEEDYFCSPEIKDRLKKYSNVRYIELPGGHDDFMTNPKPYIDLLLKELEPSSSLLGIIKS